MLKSDQLRVKFVIKTHIKISSLLPDLRKYVHVKSTKNAKINLPKVICNLELKWRRVLGTYKEIIPVLAYSRDKYFATVRIQTIYDGIKIAVRTGITPL